MTDNESFLTKSSAIKAWRLFVIRFLLFFFAWGGISLALESPSRHLFRIAAEALIFSAVLLFISASGRFSVRVRGIVLVLLALIGILLLTQVWRGGHTKAPDALNQPRGRD
jgi:hypothetical protein